MTKLKEMLNAEIFGKAALTKTTADTYRGGSKRAETDYLNIKVYV